MPATIDITLLRNKRRVLARLQPDAIEITETQEILRRDKIEKFGFSITGRIKIFSQGKEYIFAANSKLRLWLDRHFYSRLLSFAIINLFAVFYSAWHLGAAYWPVIVAYALLVAQGSRFFFRLIQHRYMKILTTAIAFVVLVILPVAVLFKVMLVPAIATVLLIVVGGIVSSVHRLRSKATLFVAVFLWVSFTFFSYLYMLMFVKWWQDYRFIHTGHGSGTSLVIEERHRPENRELKTRVFSLKGTSWVLPSNWQNRPFTFYQKFAMADQVAVQITPVNMGHLIFIDDPQSPLGYIGYSDASIEKTTQRLNRYFTMQSSISWMPVLKPVKEKQHIEEDHIVLEKRFMVGNLSSMKLDPVVMFLSPAGPDNGATMVWLFITDQITKPGYLLNTVQSGFQKEKTEQQ